jgi:hypothetical protein
MIRQDRKVTRIQTQRSSRVYIRPLSTKWDKLQDNDRFRDLKDDFVQRHRGNWEFFTHLWKKSVVALDSEYTGAITASERRAWRKMFKFSKEMAPVLETIRVLGADDNMRDRIVRALKRLHFLAASYKDNNTRAGGRIQEIERCYWCSALIPYFAFPGRKDRMWEWLTRWFDLIEGDKGKVPGEESLRKWWEQRVSYWDKQAREIARKNKKFLEDGGALNFGDHLTPPFTAALEYLYWSECPLRPDERGKYREVIGRELPFMITLGWIKKSPHPRSSTARRRAA